MMRSISETRRFRKSGYKRQQDVCILRSLVLIEAESTYGKCAAVDHFDADVKVEVVVLPRRQLEEVEYFPEEDADDESQVVDELIDLSLYLELVFVELGDLDGLRVVEKRHNDPSEQLAPFKNTTKNIFKTSNRNSKKKTFADSYFSNERISLRLA